MRVPIRPDDPCPCGGVSYAACCAPRHDGSRPAETAEALMRSRYAAFALCLPDYLQATHDAPASARRRRELEAAARAVTWLGLTIHRAEAGGPGDQAGVVEFTARSRDERHAYALHERSRFRRVGRWWRYVDGECRLEQAAVEPLVFLPGAAGSAGFWRPVAERLGDLGPAHLVGYPGFAGAPRDPAVGSLDDLYRRVLAGLPPGRSCLVAQSMGGVLAVRLALDAPERVSRLVLAATSGGVDVAALGGADWRPEYLAERPEVPDWFVRDRTDLDGRLGELAVPCLLLWSDADPVSPLAVGHHLAGRIRGSRLVVVPGGSHAFASERADEVAGVIRAFLG